MQESEYQHFIDYCDKQIKETIDLIDKYPKEEQALKQIIRGWDALKTKMVNESKAASLQQAIDQDGRSNSRYEKKYNVWGGNPLGTKPDYSRCAEVVSDGIGLTKQCSRKRGHGSDEAYCKQHSKN